MKAQQLSLGTQRPNAYGSETISGLSEYLLACCTLLPFAHPLLGCGQMMNKAMQM